MKKLGVLVVAIVFLVSLTGCSGISQDAYQVLVDNNTGLREQIAELEKQVAKQEELQSIIMELEKQVAGQKELQNKIEVLTSDCKILEVLLNNVYDGYRNCILQTTIAVAEDSLSMTEWESILGSITEKVLTFDEITAILNDIDEDLN